jgi:integration host factor subunit beta
MTKSELIYDIERRFSHRPAWDIERAIGVLLEAMSAALTEGERIEIRGFGSFSLHRRSARIARNPKTSEQVMVPAKQLPHFRPGKELRQQVNRLQD